MRMISNRGNEDVNSKILSCLPNLRLLNKHFSQVARIGNKDPWRFIDDYEACVHSIGQGGKCAVCKTLLPHAKLYIRELMLFVRNGSYLEREFIDCCREFVSKTSLIVLQPGGLDLNFHHTHQKFNANFHYAGFVHPRFGMSRRTDAVYQTGQLYALYLREFFPMMKTNNSYVVGLIHILTGINIAKISRHYHSSCLRLDLPFPQQFSDDNVVRRGDLIEGFRLNGKSYVYRRRAIGWAWTDSPPECDFVFDMDAMTEYRRPNLRRQKKYSEMDPDDVRLDMDRRNRAQVIRRTCTCCMTYTPLPPPYGIDGVLDPALSPDGW
jgi:hypothetical protein